MYPLLCYNHIVSLDLYTSYYCVKLHLKFQSHSYSMLLQLSLTCLVLLASKSKYFHLLFKLRPSSLDFVSFLSHVFLYAPSSLTHLPWITRFKCENISYLLWLSIVQSKLHIISFQIVRLSPRPISTSQLHTLLHFHSLPIYHLFLMGSYYLRMGYLILRLASCLDAFSTYLNRT